MNSEFYLSTDMVASNIRNDFWRDTSRIIYEVSPIGKDSQPVLEGSVRSRLFGDIVVGETAFNSQICRRTPEIIRQSHLDTVLLQLIINGDYVGDFDGNEVSVKAGDMFFMDLTKVLESRKNPGNPVTLAIPRHEIISLFGNRDLHGMVLPKNVATSHILFNYILGIQKTLDFMHHDEIPAVHESLMTLMRSAVDNSKAGDVRRLLVCSPMRQRILDFIYRNITDHELGPAAIMRQFHISHSHLYRAFEPDGGVARVIRNKRLDIAYQILTFDVHRLLTLKQVRSNVGFPDRSQFSKFFNERFNVSPQDVHGKPHLADNKLNILHSHVASMIENSLKD